MIFLITPSNRDLYKAELDEMFRLRHEVLVETLQWQGLTSDSGRERDEFDNDEARYLGMQDGAGEIVGCMRLNRADVATLTSTVFSHLVQFADLPSGDTVFDVSRYLTSRQWQPSLSGNVQNLDILCAVYELGLQEGISNFTAVISTNLLSSLLQIGVEVNALGFPSKINGDDCIAIASPASHKNLTALYRATHNSQPRLSSWSAGELLNASVAPAVSVHH
jgi:acyl-homoserine lactone synthase